MTNCNDGKVMTKMSDKIQLPLIVVYNKLGIEVNFSTEKDICKGVL